MVATYARFVRLGTAAGGDDRAVSEGIHVTFSGTSRDPLPTVVFTLLTLHFASLAATYLFAPEFAVRQFSRVDEWLGGVEFAPPEVTAWRYATVCGMATLAVMTLLMLVDVRRNYPMIVPAAFFKVVLVA